ncbi:MAG: transglycosylase domain-containing protein, partial [Balneolaceae bacterium]|nr:transglycosylase domain-containing protein [Balneolaceae bacterium]
MANKKTSFSKFLGYLGLSLFSTLAGIAFLTIFLTGLGLFGPVPGHDDLHELRQDQNTLFFSSDGKQIGSAGGRNSIQTELDEISPFMIDALLAIEDVRFFSHNGIDNRALVRVLVKTILLGQDSGGGSTLTQQLAKNLYPREYSRGFFLITDKIREMIIARRMEMIFTKEEILTLYFNRISFGEDTFGIEMASRRFFNTSASNLTLYQAATLAGVLKATTTYNPYRNPEQARERRNIVLQQMEKYEMIATDEGRTAMDQPLSTDYNRYQENREIAPYFLDMARQELSQILAELNSGNESPASTFGKGLRVVTTLDSKIQDAADFAVATQMKELQAIMDRETERSPIFGMDDPDILSAWKQTGQYRELVAQGLDEG